MKRFAVVLARQKRIKLPAGYGTSGSICRAFLEQHAPKKPAGKTTAEHGSAAAMTENTQPVRKRRRSASTTSLAPPPKRSTRGKKPRKPKFGNPPVKTTPGPHRREVGSNTPLKIPYGNKEVAQKLGARYGADGWYAPPGVDLSAFRENGWL
jgi:DNA topoisomerase-3